MLQKIIRWESYIVLTKYRYTGKKVIKMWLNQVIKWEEYAKNVAVSETLLSIDLHYFVYNVFMC